MKKLRRNDFPFLNAPATETTTTGLFLTSGLLSNEDKLSSTKSKACSSETFTTCIGFPLNPALEGVTINQQKDNRNVVT